MSRQEVLDLHGIQVLAAGDDDVLLAVNQEIEAFLVLLRHVARVQPAVLEDLCRSFRIMVVTFHNAGALHAQFAHGALLHFLIVFVHDLALPAEARHADGAHLADVLQPQVHAARTRGFRQTVVRIIFMMWEILQPMADERRRHRLRADVHQAPLGELIMLGFDVAAVEGRQNVLGPGNQQPDDGRPFQADRVQDRLGAVALEDNSAASGIQRTEPVHLGAGMVERRNAQENIVVGGLVMDRLHAGGLHQRRVVQQNGFREARRAGGIVDGGVVRIFDQNDRRGGRAVGHRFRIAFRIGRTVVADEEQDHLGLDLREDILHAADEFGAEEQHVRIRQL